MKDKSSDDFDRGSMPPTKNEDNLVYCSLDIETTGFDPQKDEILELGYVFFEVSGKGIKLGREFTQVFRPRQEVSEAILALTGISRGELEAAPSFDNFIGAIQNDLQNACIVGHNINFDINFLKSLGIKFCDKSIDTLELAQFILPTHQSYNLENLMHYFGVDHADAHRALADSKATLKVLEGLLGVYSSFPEKLKKEVKKYADRADFYWKDLLTMPFKSRLAMAVEKKPAHRVPELSSFEMKGERFYNFPLGTDFINACVRQLKKKNEKSLVIVPSPKQVMELWQQGLAEPAFLPECMFNEKAFLGLKSKDDLSSDEVKFILKVLVWRFASWQTESILNLNLSFFGGQFRHFINGLPSLEKKRKKIIACDIATFLEFQKKGYYKDRLALVAGLDEFEKAISENIGQRLSWAYLNYLLKSHYNPETSAGEVSHKQAVEEALMAADLFFGVIGAVLHKSESGYLEAKLEDLSDEILNKIRSASWNFKEKIGVANQTLKSEDIAVYVSRLDKFFGQEENCIKWLELSPKNVAFHSRPIKIRHLVENVLNCNRATMFCECLPQEKVWHYFQRRLGLERFSKEQVMPHSVKQKDLFSLLAFAHAKIKLKISSSSMSEDDMLSLCAKSRLPSAILFGSALQVKEFHHKYHAQLNNHAFVLAQMGSGGSKILRNFGIHKESILLASDKFVLKSILPGVNGDIPQNLPVKTLGIAHLPFELFTHPYLDAVAKEFENPFEDFSLPKAILNLHRLIRLFYSPLLKEVWVCDTKLSKNYSAHFIKLLESELGNKN